MDKISQTHEAINRAWRPGSLRFAKAKPGFWKQMLSTEEEIGILYLRGDMAGLDKILKEYKSLMIGVAEEYKRVSQGG